MTCIVGFLDKENDKVYIGADSLGGGGTSKTIRKDPKVFINDEYIIGFTSSFRMGQLLQFADLPKMLHEDKDDTFKFMVTKFIPSIRTLFKEGGYATISSNEESGGTFLVGLNGCLFCIEGDFQVAVPMDGYDSCGCGVDLALGSLFTSQNSIIEKRKPEYKIKLALQSACSSSAFVEGPFLILSK